MSLWLFNGVPPSNGQPVSVTVTDFAVHGEPQLLPQPRTSAPRPTIRPTPLGQTVPTPFTCAEGTAGSAISTCVDSDGATSPGSACYLEPRDLHLHRGCHRPRRRERDRLDHLQRGRPLRLRLSARRPTIRPTPGANPFPPASPAPTAPTGRAYRVVWTPTARPVRACSQPRRPESTPTPSPQRAPMAKLPPPRSPIPWWVPPQRHRLRRRRHRLPWRSLPRPRVSARPPAIRHTPWANPYPPASPAPMAPTVRVHRVVSTPTGRPVLACLQPLRREFTPTRSPPRAPMAKLPPPRSPTPWRARHPSYRPRPHPHPRTATGWWALMGGSSRLAQPPSTGVLAT